MPPPSAETIQAMSQVSDDLAGSRLPRSLARLYSHYTRLRENRSGLASWNSQEPVERLHDVMRLIEAASVQREANEDGGEWQESFRRVGEILEWLSLVEDDLEVVPVRLLAAAAYQIAGYPARAGGMLNTEQSETVCSQVLEAFLRADFASALSRVIAYWEEELQNSIAPTEPDIVDFSATFNQVVINESLSALGVVCSYLRWGDEHRLEQAISKLDGISYVLLQGINPYSWLLAKLCAEATRQYTDTDLRAHLHTLMASVSDTGRQVLERYIRMKYQNGQCLAWPSQRIGISRLSSNESFALCTPTGSGKTTVAELAILQGLFLASGETETAPLVIYIVPSKALATEVETKLARVLKNVAPQTVTVTGLYGGTDWGPTDVWLTSESSTVLICTFEKAEALVKFLGIQFLRRVSLVVIDEAHGVQFDGSDTKLQKAESRALRLEALTSRLFAYLSQNTRQGRVVALSAVAAGVEETIAQWVTQNDSANPARTPYRSTRQLIGRLECLDGRGYEIQYDRLDGQSLEVQGIIAAERPYVPNPFPPHPGGPAAMERTESSSGQRIRPFLFWAAMHLASPDEQGRQRAVLISITQGIDGYAKSFLTLLNSGAWRRAELPAFFTPPTEGRKLELWQRCLRSCADYFTTTSREYRLLQLGVVVHYGSMPGLLARLLVQVIDARIVTLVMATSTLSEGVNLPFETVLIPNLERWDNDINQRVTLGTREFSNLVGRAGRPGFGTEGRSLVLLVRSGRGSETDRRRYRALLNQLERQDEANEARSPIAQLIKLLAEQWRGLSGEEDLVAFYSWLEQTAPCDGQVRDEQTMNAIESLDTLDSLLLAAIWEIEQISTGDTSPEELEAELRRIWQHTYARYSDSQQDALEAVYVHRGQALRERIYEDPGLRRRLYKTSLPPLSGNNLLQIETTIRQYLMSGQEYDSWPDEEKFLFIQGIINLLGEIPVFSPNVGANEAWSNHLRWWLLHNRSSISPRDTQVAKWHKSISNNFIYKFNWGFGSFVSLAIDEAFGGAVLEPRLEDWPLTGLPWIVFWMKELITWGTLDPVAAYVLARIDSVTTRIEAEEIGVRYRVEMIGEDPNERLNASRIRDWVQSEYPSDIPSIETGRPPSQIRLARLLRDFGRFPDKEWRVLPMSSEAEITWVDSAGFPLAVSNKPNDWQGSFLRNFDFFLIPEKGVVLSSRYI